MISSASAARFSVSRALKKTLLHASLFMLGSLAIQLSAHASEAPNIRPALKKMLGGLPLEGKQQLQQMIGDLKKTSCGGGLTGCYQTQSGKIHLYFFTGNNAQQTFLIVVDKQMTMPHLFGSKVQRVMGQTSLRSLMISISTTDFDLTTDRMPPALKKVVDESYFGVTSIPFSSGAQMAARADLGGIIKGTMETFGVRGDQVTMRAAVVMPIPMDISSGAGAAIDMASDMADGATMKKAGSNALMPEAFVEFQFAPNARLPLLLQPYTLTDATFFINNMLTFGFKGNARFKGLEDKEELIQFKTPLTPEGAMDFIDFEYRMATPASFSLEDAAKVISAMATPDPRLAKYGGGFIRNISSFREPLLAMAKPLSMFKLKNPIPASQYRFGDSTKPWHDDKKYFNYVILGPLAEGGPFFKSSGEAALFGQNIGLLDISAGSGGFYANGAFTASLKLGPLGKVPFKLSVESLIDQRHQDITLKGNFFGQKIGITMGPTKMGIEVNASCVNPFEIKTSVDITPSTDLAQIFDGQGGVNVDPSSITGCIGKELEAAYRKIAGEYKNLSGYTADMANKELKKISDAALAATKAAEDVANKAAAESKKAAEDAAKASQKAAEDAAKAAQKAADDARRQYEQTKNAARDVANKATNGAANAFRDAGNAFKKIGKKKKHKGRPDPIFAASVYDWDYVYDTYPDLVKSGVDLREYWRDHLFRDGFRGSPEFHTDWYWRRYLDVQALCSLGDRPCVLQHWLDHGIEEGRQGSPDVSMESFMNRYPDLQATFGKRNYEDAMDFWLNEVADGTRDARPASTATGPIAGVRTVGGGGANGWSDEAVCDGKALAGWRLAWNKTVDRSQFLYSNGQYGGVQGGKDNWKVDVILPNGEYVTKIDYRAGGIIDNLLFVTNRGRVFGPYGGNGGTPGSYSATAGQSISCLSGRAGGSINQLNFTSTGPR